MYQRAASLTMSIEQELMHKSNEQGLYNSLATCRLLELRRVISSVASSTSTSDAMEVSSSSSTSTSTSVTLATSSSSLPSLPPHVPFPPVSAAALSRLIASLTDLAANDFPMDAYPAAEASEWDRDEHACIRCGKMFVPRPLEGAADARAEACLFHPMRVGKPTGTITI